MVKRTFSVNTPLYVIYKCSKCGKINFFTHIVKETQTIHADDTIIWIKDANLPSNNCDNEVETRRLVKRILEDKEKGNYLTPGFSYECCACLHKEPWAKSSRTFEDILSTILAIVVLGSIFVSLAEGSWITFLIAFGLVFGILMMLEMRKKFFIKRIKRLPKESVPYFSLVPEDAVSQFIKETKIKDFQIEKIK